MNKITIGFLFFLVFFGFSFFTKENNRPQISRLFEVDLKEVAFQAQKLVVFTNQFKGDQVGIDELRSQVATTRNAYKKIEFIVEFYFPNYSEEYINGAPLLHVERSSDFPVVVPPEGLQTLDEMVYENEEDIDKNQLIILAKKFEAKWKELVNGIENKKITDYELVEASKYQLIRISTFGISGFDTPGSANGLKEATKSLNGIRLYLSKLNIPSNTLSKIDESILFLTNNNDFESFDRLTFIRDYLNPLYTSLNQLYESKEISTSAVNPKASNLYSTDFLNPYFYSILTKDEDSDKLRVLGKKLFYDKNLSNNGKMSCGSCHKPEMAFTDGKKKSESNLAGQTLERNAPTLLNAVYSDRYFYDLRAFNLEQQAEHVIFNKKEYNTAYQSIISKLSKIDEYKSEFKQVFNTKEINRLLFSKALSSYVLSLKSFNSKFDKYIRHETNQLDQRAIKGFNLFMGKAACGTCHFPPTFSGLVPPYYNKNESEILGVLETPLSFNKRIDQDSGRINNRLQIENVWIYNKSFKTTTVRNVEYTAPYFHNGAYPTLKSVMEFYNHGGGAGIGLEVRNQTLSSDSLKLTTSEIDNIIFFLNSLSDTTQ